MIFLHLGLATVFRIKTNQPLILLVNFADKERNGLVQIKNSKKKSVLSFSSVRPLALVFSLCIERRERKSRRKEVKQKRLLQSSTDCLLQILPFVLQGNSRITELSFIFRGESMSGI